MFIYCYLMGKVDFHIKTRVNPSQFTVFKYGGPETLPETGPKNTLTNPKHCKTSNKDPNILGK